MKKSYTHIKVLLTLICLFAITSLKAQTISALTDFTGGTVAKVYCLNDQIHITATPDPLNVSGAAVTYIWRRYNGVGTGGALTTLSTTTDDLQDTPTAAGYYTYVSSTLYTVGGCESAPSAPVTIYVLPGITASITFTGASQTYCVNSIPANLVLTATGANDPTSVPEVFAYKYQWYRGTTAITGANSSTYTIGTDAVGDAVQGNNIPYTVRMTYVIKPTCTEGISNAINMNAIPLPGAPTITIQ